MNINYHMIISFDFVILSKLVINFFCNLTIYSKNLYNNLNSKINIYGIRILTKNSLY